MTIKRNYVTCRFCGMDVESTHRHDFKWHSCPDGGDFFVDGGKDYIRRGGTLSSYIEKSEDE